MRAIEIAAQSNGAHRNQDGMSVLPDGWAMIPSGMEMPNFPFGDVVAEEIDGVMTVTGWTPGTMPEPDPEPDPGPSSPATIEDRVAALEDGQAVLSDELAAAKILLGLED